MIHLQTVVNIVFADVDEEGDVVKKYPFSVEVPKMNKESMDELLKAFEKLKAELKEKKLLAESPSQSES